MGSAGGSARRRSGRPNRRLIPAHTHTPNPPPRCVCTALCVHRLPFPHYGSLCSTRGPAPAPPLNNQTPAVATDRLLCAPPCVCTALCVHRLPFPHYGSLRSTRGPAPAPPLNNQTPAVATDRLLCAPPCVCTANPSHTTARYASVHYVSKPGGQKWAEWLHNPVLGVPRREDRGGCRDEAAVRRADSAGRTSGRRFGRPIRPAEPPPSRTAGPLSAELDRRRTHRRTIPSTPYAHTHTHTVQ